MQKTVRIHGNDLDRNDTRMGPIGKVIDHDAVEAAQRSTVAVFQHRTLAGTDPALSVSAGTFVGDGTQCGRSLGHDLRIDLVGGLGGGRTGTGTVPEHVHAGKSHAAAKLKGLLELLVRLTRKANDDIA